MRFANPVAACAALLISITFTAASPVQSGQLTARADTYVGYLISTFSDANPKVQWHLSNGNTPSSYSFINKGKAVLTSTVGTKAVRDVFLAHDSARKNWYMLATGGLRVEEGKGP